MKKIILKFTLLAFVLAVVVVGCKTDTPTVGVDNFDRKTMLENWVDNIIIPSHKAYNATVQTLHSQAETFTADPNMSNLQALRTAWYDSYKAWQNVPFFIEGKGNDPDVLISFYTNIYPVKTSSVDFFVNTGTYDFTLSSNKAMQGLPALDYMLYGLGDSDDAVLFFYDRDANAANYKKYLTDLTSRIKALSDAVNTDWNSAATREKFVTNDQNTALSSVNSIVNDFIYSYEFDIRTSKVGFPSGACIGCEGTTLKGHVEAPYRRNASKALLLEALNSAQNFYNGVPFGGTLAERKSSLYDYLEELGTERDGEKLSDLVNTQFDNSRAAIEKLSDDLYSDVETRNELMVAAHNELQLNVLLLKTYMMNAMKISQDYVSSDGD